MSKKPEVTLYIPHLLERLVVWHNDFLFKPESTYLSHFFRSLEISNEEKVHGLSECFLCTLGEEGGDTSVAFNRYGQPSESSIYLCADPVHLEVGMNDVTLSEIISDITKSDAKEIISTLNQHFHQDGIEFIVDSTTPHFWYVKCDDSEIIKSVPIESAYRENIQQKLITSTKRNWRAVQNELQMLLHSSEVNHQRDLANQTTINSLWLWGGGNIQTQDEPHSLQQIISRKNLDNNVTGETYARMAGCKWKKLPENLKITSAELEGDTVIILDQLYQPAVFDDVNRYQKTLTEIDESIIRDLYDLWKKNQIEMSVNTCDGNVFRPKKTKFRAFRSKPISLLDIARKYLN